MANYDPNSSPLFEDILGGGSDQGQMDLGSLDPKTVRILLTLQELLKNQGAGRNFVNPLEQAGALAQINQLNNPTRGPSGQGIRYLYLGTPPGNQNRDLMQAYNQIAKQAMLTNVIDALNYNLLGGSKRADLTSLFGNRGGGNQATTP